MRLAALAMLFALAAAPALAQAPREEVAPVAPGVWLIASAFPPHRQPDGTTVIFRAPRGLVVMDTGRHVWRRQTILDFAKAQRRPIVAIVNSHWHLDHVSGDLALKAAYPGAKLYASQAIDEALTGFLAESAASARPYLAPGKLPLETQEDIRGDIATIAEGAALKPDVPITSSGVRSLGGLTMVVQLAPDAATAGDVWIYDPRTKVAAVGDLVTLPAPFLDTACPAGWSAALDQVAATPFATLIPGHGAPMTRAQFDIYRSAFHDVVACAASSRDKADCAAAWTQAVTPLMADDPALARRAQGMTEYYVADVLRAHGGRSAYCATP